MANIKKQDKNRFRKIYSFVRRKPSNEFISTDNGIIESVEIDFSSSTSESYTFTETYSSNPTVVVGSTSAVGSGINIFVSSLSTTSVTVDASSSFTGTVSLLVIQ